MPTGQPQQQPQQPSRDAASSSGRYTPHCILLTGGAGFIGSHVLSHLAEKYPHYRLLCLDKLSYCASEKNFSHLAHNANFRFIRGDICDSDLVAHILDSERVDTIMHFAAATHVDNSFENSLEFTQTNVMGTHVLLEAARQCVDPTPSTQNIEALESEMFSEPTVALPTPVSRIKRFIHVSTDEVYGSEPLQSHDNSATQSAHDPNPVQHQSSPTATAHNNAASDLSPSQLHQHLSPLNPTNPYAATKVAAEFLVRSYAHSFHLPCIITRGNNVYGPRQYPEKVIPKFLSLLQRGERLPLHGSGENRRSFLHAHDVARAFDLILHSGAEGEIYNIGSERELTTRKVAELCVKTHLQLQKPMQHLGSSRNDESIDTPLSDDSLSRFISYVHDRPYNDLRYFIDTSSLRALGWRQEIEFEAGLVTTAEWYARNSRYWSDSIDSALKPHPHLQSADRMPTTLSAIR